LIGPRQYIGNTMVKKTLLTVMALAFTGCCTPDTSAEKATFDAIAPAYLRYVQADPLLDDLSKQRRVRLVKSWQIRIDAQTTALGGK
jgi:hypothetical protein